MCLGVPCKVTQVGDGPMPMGTVEVLGRPREVCFAYLPHAQAGDYVLIQNGFAMDLLTATEANEAFATWKELGINQDDAQSFG